MHSELSVARTLPGSSLHQWSAECTRAGTWSTAASMEGQQQHRECNIAATDAPSSPSSAVPHIIMPSASLPPPSPPSDHPPPPPPAASHNPITLNDVKPFVFGGVASCVAEACTFPIDVAKTRLQLQRKQLRKAAKASEVAYRGMVDVWVRVAREEGVMTLYRGLPPALLRQASYGTIKFGLYSTFKELLPLPDSPGKNVLCAVVSGATASAVANPTDVLKVRLQSREAAVEGRGMWSAFGDIARREGVRGLWRGVVPTSQRAAVVAGVQLPVYDYCKSFLLRNRLMGDGAPNHLLSSFCAGLCACLASCPVDVVRTRLMSQRNIRPTGGEGGRHFLSAPTYPFFSSYQSSSGSSANQPEFYRNSMHCAFSTVRSEGFLALYKGFVPSFTRMGPWNIIFFLVYEKLKKKFPRSKVKNGR